MTPRGGFPFSKEKEKVELGEGFVQVGTGRREGTDMGS